MHWVNIHLPHKGLRIPHPTRLTASSAHSRPANAGSRNLRRSPFPENISWLRPLHLDWCRLYTNLHKCWEICKL